MDFYRPNILTHNPNLLVVIPFADERNFANFSI